MGHVKVVRRSMSSMEWINLRLGWLKRRIVEKSVPITGWQIKEARQIGEMEYEFYDKEWRTLQKGDKMFTPDGTAFLRVKTTIPDGWGNVWFSLKTASEMIVKINGKWAGGIDPNRDRFEIFDNGELLIEIEGYNRSKPDDDRNVNSRHLKGCRQDFQGAEFVALNNDVLAAYYDVAILLDIIKSEYFNEDYRKKISDQLNNALCLVDYDSQDYEEYCSQVVKMREYIQENIFDDKTYKGNGKVALVAYSHLDIAYFWRRIHSVQKNARTCLIQLKLMDKYPHFKYAHTQPFVYEQLEKFYPDIFAELKQKVENGQFEPIGAMYVEPDCNVLNAESLIRQCLYGQNYYEEKFGKISEVCWLPDVFGNSWILPQILKKSGVKYFVSNKMSTWNDTNRFPYNSFIWKGIDGSEVFASVPPTHFITWNNPEQIVENWEAYQDKDTIPETLSMFGYGDGGSGVTEEMLEYMKRFNELSVMPETRHITGEQYLKENFTQNKNTHLEVWDGELYLEMHRGTFTTKSDLKKQNRILENKLRDAEILSSLVYEKHGEYPQDKLTEMYKLLLVNQFHDIIPGSHIAPVFNDAMADYEKIHKELDEIICLAMNKLGKTCANTLPWQRTQLDESIDNIHNDDNWFTFDGETLQTPSLIIKFDKNGGMSSVYDKNLHREWVQPEGYFNKIVLYQDTPGMYDAWDILPNYKDVELCTKASLPEIVKTDKSCLIVEVNYETKKSHWKQHIKFFKNSNKIDIDNFVNWNENQCLAKAVFDVNVLARTAICDMSAGICLRDTHKNTSWQQARYEVCQHKFTDLSENGEGVALINNSKYGISLENSTMGLSLLRATERPDVFADRGYHEFSYSIFPHDDNVKIADIIKYSWEYNIAPIGDGIPETLFLLDSENVFLQTIKKAEKEEKLVIRLVEQSGRRGSAILKLPFDIKKAGLLDLLEREFSGSVKILDKNKLKFSYMPFEIITIGVEF